MPATVHISPLPDPTLDRVGFPLDHPYLEQVYCSVLGPTTVLLLRRIGDLLDGHPEGVHLDLVETSRSLGVGARGADDAEVGRNAPIRRALDRIAMFGLGKWTEPDEALAVHAKVPALSRHKADRLPEKLQAVHRSLLTEHLDGLVALTEGRAPGQPVLAPIPTRLARDAAPAAHPAAAARESEVAARLRAFGANGHGPRSVTR